MRLALISAFALFAAAALADTPHTSPDPETLPDDPPLAEAEETFFDEAGWRQLVDGKTLTYVIGGGVLGREWYEPGTDRVVYVYSDGRCYDGSWNESGGVFCFRYDGIFCFYHLRRGAQLIAREVDGDEQLITRIADNEPLSCTPDVTS